MLEILLKTHRDVEEIDFSELWKSGLFVFDSNVLLDLYRLPESASNDLLGVLQDAKISGRIWIGFQVLLEFMSNRHEAISDQKNKFSTVRTLLEEAIGQYDNVFEKLTSELGKLKLKQRHSLIDPDKFLTSSGISQGRSLLEEFVRDLGVLESKQSDVNDRDEIKDVVIGIFKNKVGAGFTRKELEDLYKIAEKRYEASVPPGYKDKAKQGSYFVEDREFVRKYGDFILWKEVIRKAASEQISGVVLVTGDVKEDWWLEKRGKKLGPRKELLNEIYTEAPCVQYFYMYDTASFLKHAKVHLEARVQDSSITQAKDLIAKSRKNRASAEAGYLLIPECIGLAASPFEALRVGIGRSVYKLPPLRMDQRILYSCIVEIFQNALQHGVHSYVGVQAKDRDETIVLRFKNRTSTRVASPTPNLVGPERGVLRGGGLQFVHELMSREGVMVATVASDKLFVVELVIHKSKFASQVVSPVI